MFTEWLEKEKTFTPKAAHDVGSRLKRVQKLIGRSDIPDNALTLLETNQDFQSLTMCVKSQLRRTTKLFLEYKQSIKEQ